MAVSVAAAVRWRTSSTAKEPYPWANACETLVLFWERGGGASALSAGPTCGFWVYMLVIGTAVAAVEPGVLLPCLLSLLSVPCSWPKPPGCHAAWAKQI